MKKIFFALVCVLNIFVAYKGYELLTLSYDPMLDDRHQSEKPLSIEARFSLVRVFNGLGSRPTYHTAHFVDDRSKELVIVRLTSLLNKTFNQRNHPFVGGTMYSLDLVQSQRPIRAKSYDGVPQYDIIEIKGPDGVIASIHSQYYKKSREAMYKTDAAILFIFLILMDVIFYFIFNLVSQRCDTKEMSHEKT